LERTKYPDLFHKVRHIKQGVRGRESNRSPAKDPASIKAKEGIGRNQGSREFPAKKA
jgi:hypothetical protein